MRDYDLLLLEIADDDWRERRIRGAAAPQVQAILNALITEDASQYLITEDASQYLITET